MTTVQSKRLPPPHPDCALEHHRPGSRVRFQRWSSRDGCVATVWGTVVAHRPGHRTMTITPISGGAEVVMSCGSVGPA